MGDILNILEERKARLLAKKSFILNASTQIIEINAAIAKLDTIIEKIKQGGWDA